MREFNAIFPEIKYDLRKCLECDDIFTPAYRHPIKSFAKIQFAVTTGMLGENL